MGVPKFFRYISERYPCLSELVKDYQIPEFDNLYLDMNGIIHMCSHPNDFDPHFRISEEKIFQDIFHYLEILFRMIQPRKLFFMAVDGVAPRAKMNQQRGRRFRSAKEAEILEKRAKQKGEKLPTEARFDSNCITPGTVFMARLHDQLKYFVSQKISTDKNWKGVKVILSGHETPGEGEHKIMDYIRWMKAQPDYDANTRHCLYGLDADLMMLGLCTHEPHFSLLREEVKFGKQAKRASAPEETRFYLLHLSLMREYLGLEFQALKGKLSFPYNLESIIDDWVLMGFLVGNDFIPHLPDVHISNGALPMLYNAYMDVLPTLDGYINENGHLRLDRFQKFMEKLAAFDVNQFKETYADLKYFESKTGRKLGASERHSYNNGEIKDGPQKSQNSELDALIKATEEFFFEDENGLECEDDEEESDEDDRDVFSECVYENESDSEASTLFKMEFHQHKKHYYKSKLEYGKVTEQVLRDQAEGYVRAIQWNLHYYYHGCASWSWYYPHHYAPYISDICNFKDVRLEFEEGKPFLPFEQLLAVLPAASKTLLPAPYQELMVEADSPIIEYYPVEFRTDLNGKKQEWEAVVLIPFIAEDRLLTAMKPCQERLSEEENKRNSYGPMLEYTYSEEDLGEYEAPEFFPPIKVNHARLTPIWRKDLHLSRDQIVHGLLPGARLEVYFPGFPTFKHLPYTGELRKAKVHVFDQASRGDNMILTLVERPAIKSMKLEDAVKEYLGKDLYCGWPHLTEARVVAVADGKKRHNYLSSGKTVVEELQGNLAAQFVATKNGITERYMSKQGVSIGESGILVYACHVDGRKYVFGPSGKITLEKMHCKDPTPYAVQTVVKDIAVHDPSFVQYRTVGEVFPPGSTCFMLGPPYYGAMGEVLESGPKLGGRVKVTMTVVEEPNIDRVQQNQHLFSETYMPGGKAAQRIGISPHILSRITGTIFIITGNKQAENPSKLNAGLNLKFNKKNEEVPGYTRKENTMWLYSFKTVDLVREYSEKFPEIFDHISRHSSNDVYDDGDIFPGDDCHEKVKELTKWLKEVPSAKVDRRACGSEVLEDGVVSEIKNVIDKFFAGQWKVKHVVMRVKPHILYKSELRFGNMAPDPNATHHLFDRVVNVREDSAVPMGLKGTIIGIHKAEKDADVMYDMLFDREFPAGMNIGGAEGRSYRVPRTVFLNLSHGQRQESGRVTSISAGSTMSAGSRPNSAFASWNPNQGNQGANWRHRPEGQNNAAQQAFKFPAPPNISPKHKNIAVAESSNEQLLWKELQMMSGKNSKTGFSEPPPASTLPKPKEHHKSSTPSNNKSHQQQKQPKNKCGESDGTAMLKKWLRIPNEDGEEVSLRPQQVKPVTVESIMKAAAVPESKSSNHSGTTNEGSNVPNIGAQLLDFYQRKGLGIPRFAYVSTPDGMTRAELTLPDRSTVQGDWAPTKNMATESAASQGWRLLGFSKDSRSNMVVQVQPPSAQVSGQPQQFFRQFSGHFPPSPRLPFPNMEQESQRRQQFGIERQGPPPIPPFSRAPPPFSQEHKYRDQNGSDWRSPQQQQQPVRHQIQRQQHYQQHHLNQQQQQQQHRQQVHKHQPQHQVDSKPYQGKTQEPTHFVPLQAVKQQRTATAAKSASLLRREHEALQAGQSSNTDDQKCNAQEQELMATRKVDQTESKQNSTQPASTARTISEALNEETRSVSRVRKSRLAINFSVPAEK